MSMFGGKNQFLCSYIAYMQLHYISPIWRMQRVSKKILDLFWFSLLDFSLKISWSCIHDNIVDKGLPYADPSGTVFVYPFVWKRFVILKISCTILYLAWYCTKIPHMHFVRDCSRQFPYTVFVYYIYYNIDLKILQGLFHIFCNFLFPHCGQRNRCFCGWKTDCCRCVDNLTKCEKS